MKPLVLTLALILFAACAPQRPSDATNEAPRDVSAATPAQRPPSPAPTSTPTPAPAETPARATPALALDGEGLRLFNRVSGAARPIAFATPRGQTLAMLEFRGPPTIGTQTECGAGALDFAAWPDGLKLYFQRDKFVGWAVDGRIKGTLATAAGIGPGSSRAALSDAYAATYSTTTLGTEFAAGGLFGLLTGPRPSATISDMWAGVSCNFR